MDKKNTTYDFTIIGGGLIGSLVSVLLSRNGFKCCLVERNSLAKMSGLKKFSPLSLNYRSIQILKKFDLWDKEVIEASPIRNLTMKCFNSLNRLKFSSSDVNLRYLGYIVNKFLLHNYFIDIAKKQEGLDIFENSSVTELEYIKNQTSCLIKTSSKELKKIHSKFTILSDGEPSELKEKLGFKTSYDYHNQTSYMIDCEAKIEVGAAVQLFNQDGIFALIPYSTNKTSLILSLNDENKDKYINEKNQVSMEYINKIFSNYLENIKEMRIISSYKLKSSKSKEIIKDNVLLLGNTSQLLHPVGAQGFNLGLRNIESVIDLLNRKTNLKEEDISKKMNQVGVIIRNDRKDILQMTDIATNFLASSKSIPRIISSLMINFLKISQKSKLKFLKKVLGIDNCSYLTIKG